MRPDAKLVATVSDEQRDIAPSAYAADIEAWQDSREFREIDRLMRERNGVRM
jgi:hypothetical protein